jgi:hypothetical protein
MSADDEAGVARRLAATPMPADWVGVCVKVVPARSESTPAGVEHTPEHYLAAAWPPGADGWTRWPEAVVIGSPTPTRTLSELLRHLPARARLHLAGLDDVDAELAARILLAADRNLEPYQRAAVAAFADAQRARTLAFIVARYSDRDPAFERFRGRVVGPAATD